MRPNPQVRVFRERFFVFSFKTFSWKHPHSSKRRCATCNMPLCFHTTLLLWLVTQHWCSLQVAALAPASRRQWLIQGGASVASIASVASPAHSVDTAGSIVVPGGAAPYKPKGIGVSSWDPPAVQTKLAQSRLLAKELSPLQQPFRGGQELYYSQFLFGAWTTKSTLKRKIYPCTYTYFP